MEEMRRAAMAYYANMTDNQKQYVLNFRKSLDANGDGKVSIQEFSKFIKEDYKREVPQNLFDLLDRDKDGNLDNEECLTLFYMITCGRFVFCGRCKEYLMGFYFSCVQCYTHKKKTYDLCCSCYGTKKFKHRHTFFLDNYALLRIKPWEPNASVFILDLPPPASNAIVPYNFRPQSQGPRILLKVVEIAITTAVNTLCTIM